MKGGDDMLGLLVFGAALVALELVAHLGSRLERRLRLDQPPYRLAKDQGGPTWAFESHTGLTRHYLRSRATCFPPKPPARIEYARSAGRGRQPWLPASTWFVFVGAKATNASRGW